MYKNKTTCCHIWLSIALHVVIKYQIVLSLKHSKTGGANVVYCMCIVYSQPVRQVNLCRVKGIAWDSAHTPKHTHTHSVGFLWMNDQSDAETSTWQHTTLTTDIHAPGRICKRNRSKRVATDLWRRRSGHRDRLTAITLTFIVVLLTLCLWVPTDAVPINLTWSTLHEVMQTGN
jgi:hypothetical protein